MDPFADGNTPGLPVMIPTLTWFVLIQSHSPNFLLGLMSHTSPVRQPDRLLSREYQLAAMTHVPLPSLRPSTCGHVSSIFKYFVVIIVEPWAQTEHVIPMSLNYKFVVVHQEVFPSFLPRRLGIRFISKALVGEHRTLSSCIAWPWPWIRPAAQTFRSRSHAHRIHAHSYLFQIFLNMRIYMNFTVLALAASIISPVLSTPIRFW